MSDGLPPFRTRGMIRSRSDIMLPSHWSGPKEVYRSGPKEVSVVVLGRRRVQWFSPEEVPVVAWGGPHGSRARLAPPPAATKRRDIKTTQNSEWRLSHGDHLLTTLSEQELSHQQHITAAAEAATTTVQAERKAAAANTQREELKQRLSSKRAAAHKQALDRGELHRRRQRAEALRRRHVQRACDAPLQDDIVFLPSLPEAARMAKASWACDAAPPEHTWEYHDARQRVQELSEATERVQSVLGVWSKQRTDRVFVERLEARATSKVGHAPKPDFRGLND